MERRNKKQPAATDSGAPTSSPQTDPTNPVTQEAAGEQVAGERASERREREPGLTNPDREQRVPGS